MEGKHGEFGGKAACWVSGRAAAGAADWAVDGALGTTSAGAVDRALGGDVAGTSGRPTGNAVGVGADEAGGAEGGRPGLDERPDCGPGDGPGGKDDSFSALPAFFPSTFFFVFLVGSRDFSFNSEDLVGKRGK